METGGPLRADRWLEERLGKPQAGKTVLVLCRSRATVSRVRRWMAEQGGWIGADVVSPHGLLASIERDPLAGRTSEGIEELPTDNPITALIGERPGLIAVARRWVRRLREIRACGQLAPGAPPWLCALADSPWIDDGSSDRLVDALDRLKARPMAPTEGHAYARVVLLGFDAGPEVLEPAARTVASVYAGGQLPQAIPALGAPIPSISVPDAAAEVRMAVQLAREANRDTLVLVSENTTARRLRDALERNGIPCSFTDPPAAAASAIGGLALRMVPWFEQPDPPMRVSDVAWVFGHRAIGGAIHPQAAQAIERDRLELGLPEDAIRLGRRRLIAMLREVKILDAPLSRWLERLRVLRQDAARTEPIRGAALALEARLRLLRARAEGQAPERAFEDALPAAIDDFDALVAELLGEEAEALLDLPCAHTLGGLRKYLTDLRPRVHDDPAARAVLGQLRERDAVPADPATAREALGTPVDPGRLSVGVDVMTYDDFDGRPSGLLLLLDVHHKGLARRPTPDPLLDDSEQEALGLPAGQHLVDFRVGQVHRALAKAERTVALVAERDAGGRDLVPPIQLDLVHEDRPDTRVAGSYGLRLDLPEARRAGSLAVLPSERPVEPTEGPDELRALAVQAAVEWYRTGRGPLPSDRDRTIPRYASLDQRVEALGPPAPPWAMPWLGDAQGVPEAALPDRPWSNSRLFEPLSTCLYRAFGKAVLRVEPPEEIAEDLDPREIGTAIHGALENLGAGLRLRVGPDEIDLARAEVVEGLRASTQAALEKLADELQGLSEARRAAVHGRIARWNAHWPSWAASRVQVKPKADYGQRKVFCRTHPYTQAAAQVMQREVPGTTGYPLSTLAEWLANTADAAFGGNDPALWTDAKLAREGDRWGGLRADIAHGLRAFLETEHFARVCNVIRSAEIRAKGSEAEVLATAVEVPFGRPDDAPGQLIGPDGTTEIALGEISVQLGSAPVRLSGRVDRVVVAYRRDRPLFEVVDYKTGKSKPASSYGLQQDLMLGKRPQLILYALALQAAEQAGGMPPALEHALVAAVGWDHVRITEEDPEEGDRRPAPNKIGRYLVDTAVLEAVGARIGRLLDEGRAGRWHLAPRRDACPALYPWGGRVCDLKDACRLRALPPEREVAQ